MWIEASLLPKEIDKIGTYRQPLVKWSQTWDLRWSHLCPPRPTSNSLERIKNTYVYLEANPRALGQGCCWIYHCQQVLHSDDRRWVSDYSLLQTCKRGGSASHDLSEHSARKQYCTVQYFNKIWWANNAKHINTKTVTLKNCTRETTVLGLSSKTSFLDHYCRVLLGFRKFPYNSLDGFRGLHTVCSLD